MTMDEKRENILIIGNGFDLAHGLPTKYSDFLKFVEILDDATNGLYQGSKNQFINSRLEDSTINEKIKQDLISIFDKKRSNNLTKNEEELIGLICDNFWIKYFKKNKNYINENWIDFESEISKVIQRFEKFFVDIRSGKERKSKPTFFKFFKFEKLENIIDEYCISLSGSYSNSEQCQFEFEHLIKELKDILKKDLLRLIRTLEIYLCTYVEQIDIKQKSPDIEEIEFDKILSFNYTSTYKKIYNKFLKKDDCDFIHGEAVVDNSLKYNNMVLGIDDYLTDDKVNQDIEYIYFKKYFQRIIKHTDNKYIKWITEISTRRKKYNIYIFGHSLDITDKDVLEELILTEYSVTTIFYKDQDMLESQVANLVKVIGKDELLSRTGKNAHLLKFEKQADFVDIDSNC